MAENLFFNNLQFVMSQDITKKSRFISFWILGLGLILSLIVSLYYSNIWFGIENFSNYISLPLYMIIPSALVLLGILALIRANKIIELSRTSLIFLVISFSCSLAAEQTWNLYEHVLDIDPYPSIADFFYLSAPIFMFISLMYFLKPVRNQISKKTIIFATALSALLLIPTVIATYNVGIEDTPFEIFVAVLYPIVDSILLTSAIIAILFSVLNKRNFFWIMILTGIIILISADTVFLFLIIDDTYVDGHPVDILWIFAYTIWAFMMYYIIHKSNHSTTKQDDPKKYKIEGVEKFGIIVALILINVTIGIILVSLNYFMDVGTGENILPYFSWFLIMIVIIFSSIIIFLNSKLNKTLAFRTVKLEEVSQELIKSERFSAIGELAARLAHDMKNPLSIIKGAGTYLKMKNELNEKSLDNLQRMQKAVDRIDHQISNVLDFVKIREPKMVETRLDSIFDTVIENIELPKSIKLQRIGDSCLLRCDPSFLEIIFVNIIINAVQAMNEKGSITIKTTDDAEYVMIEIENSGPAIPEEILSDIFEPLFTTKMTGTGLGLASCSTIVKQHGGTIQAYNNPTRFVIKLPKNNHKSI